MLFKAELYGQSGDYPEALGVFLEAEKVIGGSSNSIVRGWTYKGLGDLYFLRGMFQEAVPYYKRFNEIVTQCRDTLRMAYSAFSMGRVYTVKGQVDSIIHYYKRAIALASGLPQEANIVPYANHALCDIYIQAEEFDSALIIMPHDQLNDDNWAYWYYGQHHVDSAISCFRNIVGQNGWSCDVEYLSKLAQLEVERGNHEQALRDYEALAMAKDSLAAEAQIEELQKAQSQYQFNTIVKERDMIAHGRRTLQQYAIGISLVTIILLILTLYFWKSYKKGVEKKLVHQKIVEQELENRALALKNQSNEAKEQRQELLNELYRSELFHRLKSTDGKVRRQLSEKEWDYLVGHYLDPIYDHLTNRLTAVAQLSITELRICYLVKLGVTPTVMADILSKTKGAISQARKRMYQKMTGQKGGAERFDELMRVF